MFLSVTKATQRTGNPLLLLGSRCSSSLQRSLSLYLPAHHTKSPISYFVIEETKVEERRESFADGYFDWILGGMKLNRDSLF